MTHENEGCVQALVTLFHVIIIPVKISRFPAVHSEEVHAQVPGPQRVELEGGLWAGSDISYG